MHAEGMARERVLDRVSRARQSNVHFGDGRVLGSMCTEPHDIAKEVFTQFWESNLGNPGLYPGTGELEREVVASLGELFHLPSATGKVLSGGTESNLTALWIARKITGKREVVFSKNAHFSIRKAVDILGMEPVMVDLDDRYVMDISQAEDRIGNETAAVVGVAGTTELGVVDPISELSSLCQDGIHLHVDAAFGGFVLPFLEELGREVPPFDFSLERVSTITCDPHKMGRSTIPSGVLMARDRDIFNRIAVESPYLTQFTHNTLLGTRNSASVAATWAVMNHMGRKGYVNQVRSCMKVTDMISRRITKMGLDIVVPPVTNLLGIRLNDPAAVESAMTEKGWYLSKAHNPCCLRLVVMPHVSRDSANALLEDLETVCRDTGEI